MPGPKSEDPILPIEKKPSFGGNILGVMKGGYRWTLIISMVVAVGVVAAYMFGLGTPEATGPQSSSVAPRGPGAADPMGPNSQTPVMKEAFRLDEERRVTEAMKTNQSASPVITQPLQPREVAEDPTIRAVPKQQDRTAQVVETRVQVSPEQIDAIRAQQRELIQKWTQKSRPVLVAAQEETKPEGVQQASAAPATSTTAAAATSANQGPILARAGAIYYAAMGNSANSDRPGPVKAQLLNGPLKGAELIGTFERVDEVLVVKFASLSMPNGDDKQIEAYAIDPNTAEPGIAGNVDPRYFLRYVLPIAADFARGFGQAIARSGTTTTNTLFGQTTTTATSTLKDQMLQAAGEAGAAGARLLNENKPNGPLVTAAAGDPIGIMFIRSVR